MTYRHRLYQKLTIFKAHVSLSSTLNLRKVLRQSLTACLGRRPQVPLRKRGLLYPHTHRPPSKLVHHDDDNGAPHRSNLSALQPCAGQRWQARQTHDGDLYHDSDGLHATFFCCAIALHEGEEARDSGCCCCVCYCSLGAKFRAWFDLC